MEYWRLEYFLSFGFMNKFEKIEKSGILRWNYFTELLFNV